MVILWSHNFLRLGRLEVSDTSTTTNWFIIRKRLSVELHRFVGSLSSQLIPDVYRQNSTSSPSRNIPTRNCSLIPLVTRTDARRPFAVNLRRFAGFAVTVSNRREPAPAAAPFRLANFHNSLCDHLQIQPFCSAAGRVWWDSLIERLYLNNLSKFKIWRSVHEWDLQESNNTIAKNKKKIVHGCKIRSPREPSNNLIQPGGK